MRRFAPVFILLLLAPSLGELLLGDIPFSFQLIPIFLLDMALYGAGAILIRETVRRRDLGWTGILLFFSCWSLLSFFLFFAFHVTVISAQHIRSPPSPLRLSSLTDSMKGFTRRIQLVLTR